MSINLKEMLDAGVHFGHQTKRWNPKMGPYVYTQRDGIHIIDLQQSLEKAKEAAEFVKSQAALGKQMIFVGTKKQAVEPIKEAAAKSGQYYVVKRWLGGMMTNFVTIKKSIDRMRKIEKLKETGDIKMFSKKEISKIDKEYIRLVEYLEGIREMKEPPGIMFVVDAVEEAIAVAEAKKLGIPVVAIADTNADPETVDYCIPGNDDAIRSIKLFCNLVADSFIEGNKEWNSKKSAQVDKSEVEAKKEEVELKPAAKATEKDSKPSAGPAVVKVAKRKLVAAGMAEEVEIVAEVENKETVVETPESTTEGTTATSEEVK